MVHTECLLVLAILVCGATCQPTTSDAKIHVCEEGDFGSPRTSCPKGFNYSFDGIPKCYTVVTTITDWATAKSNCKKLHPRANLVSINSGLENQVLFDVLNDYKCPGKGDPGEYATDSFWTSGRRRSDNCDDSFVWKRDEQNFYQSISDYTNWAPGEPNCYHNGEEHCLSIRRDDFKDGHGQWNDVKCSAKLCSVCELVLS